MPEVPALNPQTTISETSSSPLPAPDRLKAGLWAKAILDQFWHDDATPKAVQVLQLKGWINVLSGFSEDEIEAAWTAYQVGGPRSQAGRLNRPDAGSLALIIAAMRRGISTTNPSLLCHRAFNPTSADLGLQKAGSWEERVR